MKKLLPLMCLFFNALVLQAQSRVAKNEGHILTAEAHSLLSTHGTVFKGASVLYAKEVDRFTIGLGTEYTYAPFHLDNGWQLSHLHFLPFFAHATYSVIQKKKWDAFLAFASGVSFTHYQKDDGIIPGNYKVVEKGLYLNAGTGMRVTISNQWKALAGVGLKGFKMSFNAYDVNPHGVVARAGLQYTMH